MKRTCNGCKALDIDHCSLGYKTKPKFFDDRIVGRIPLEECEKPMTYSYFLTLKKHKYERDKGGEQK